MNPIKRTIFKTIKNNDAAPLNIIPLKPKINDSLFSKQTQPSTKDNSKIEITNAKNKNNLVEYIQNNNKDFLENFEVLDYVSSGSVGTFYEGKYKKGSKQKIGLKFYLNRKKNEKNEEVNFLRKIKNKNIVGLFGYLKINDNNTCSVLELAKYGDLENFQKKILKRAYLTETLLCYLAKQILDALKYIHNSKILHSDIKQNNILIDYNLNVKLTDFSVSSSYENKDPNSKINFPFVGTSKFISPEILEKTKILVKNANKIDIYSMGIMLYYLAFGTYPYDLKYVKSKDYENILNTLKNKKKLEFLEHRKISGMFQSFLEGILELDINKRLDIESALKHPWILGANIIMDEKEKLCCLQKFLVKLVTDDILEFNEYIKCEDEEKRKQMIDYY